MKKFYSIIALMLLFVGSAWGDNLITENQTVTLGEQVISASDMETGDYILQNAKTKYYYYENEGAIYVSTDLKPQSIVHITVTTDNSGNKTCTIQAYSGNYYGNLTKSTQISTVTTANAGTYSILTPTTITDSDLGSDMGIWFKNGDNYINRSDDNTQGTGFTGTGAYSRQYVYKANIVTSVDVTYRVVDTNGKELTSTTGKEAVGGTPTMPSSFSNDYVTLSDPTPATVDANTETITYTATINLPFTPSTSYENATWYYVKLRGAKYLIYDADNTTSTITLSTTKTINSTGQWAFIGNPYSSFKIINKAASQNASTNQYLNAVASPSNGGYTGGVGNYDESLSNWTLVKNTNTNANNGVSFKIAGSTNSFITDYGGGSNAYLKFWNSNSNTSDYGSAFEFEEFDFSTITSDAINDLSNYVTNLPVLFDSEALTAATNSINSATSSNYESVIASAKTTFMQSAAGKPFYLHTYYNSGRPEGTLRDNNSKLAVDTCSYESEFQFVTTSTGIALQNVFTGNYVQDVTQSQDITTGTEPKDFNIVLDEVKNVVNIGQTGDYSYIHNGAGNIVGWTTGGAAKWIIRSYSDTDADMLAGAAYQIEQINNNRIGTKWGDYKATDEYTEAYSTFTSDGGNTKANYKAVLDNLTEFVGSDGFVNIANTSTAGAGNSIGLMTGDENGHIHAQTTDVNDVSQLWIVTSPSASTVNLFNVNAQKYMGPNIGGGSNTVSLSETAVNWTIEWKDDNTFILKSGTGTFDHLNYEGGTGNEGNLNHWSGNDTWAATPVASINLPVHAVGDYSYATICYPFEVELSAGSAYKATYNSANSSLTLASIGQTVPAGTPVVVVVDGSSVESITATINGTETKAVQTSDDNALSGTYLPLSITTQNDTLTLGTDGTNAGFYKWAGSIQNKAFYIYSGGTQAKGFAFSFGDDDPTGISEELIKEAVKELQGQRYNVQGQPVGADYKGIIIQNGKKYLQK